MLYEFADEPTRVMITKDQTGQIVTTRPYTAAENAAADQAAQAAAVKRTRLDLDDKVRVAVTRDGTIDAVLGTVGTPWAPGQPLTLRGWKAMSNAQMKALTLAQTQELLTKLAPILVDLAIAQKQAGKLAVQVYDGI